MTDTPKRGRPASGTAMTNAERQRRYIERLKAQTAPPSPAPDADLSRQLALAQEEIRRLNQEGDRLFLKIDQLTRGNDARESKIADLSKRLDAATQAREVAIAETIEAKAALALALDDIKRLEREIKRYSREIGTPDISTFTLLHSSEPTVPLSVSDARDARDAEILARHAAGEKNRPIARDMGISEGTVRNVPSRHGT